MTFDSEFTVLSCITCGARHAISTVQYEHARKRGKFEVMIHCPNGHQYGWGEGELERVRQERDRLKQQVAQKDDEIASERKRRHTAEAKVSRVERRAKAALCPCCNRSFVALRRHMATMHPDQNVVPLKGKAG